MHSVCSKEPFIEIIKDSVTVQRSGWNTLIGFSAEINSTFLTQCMSTDRENSPPLDLNSGV